MTMKRILILSFLSVLLFPWVNHYTKWIAEKENTENRQLAERPQFNVQHLDAFPKDFNSYLNDHFPLRNWLICAENTLNYKLFHKTASHSIVVKGNDDWLFTREDLKQHYRNAQLFTDAEVDTIVQKLARRNAWCQQNNMRFFVGFLPRKYTLYPEEVPVKYQKLAEQSNTERVIARLKAETEVEYIDVLPALLEAKKEGQVFHKLDMHWNDWGAFHACRSIVQQLQEAGVQIADPLRLDQLTKEYRLNAKAEFINTFCMLQPLQEEQLLLKVVHSEVSDGVLSGYEAPGYFAYVDEYEIVKVNPASSGPRIFVIRDSFGRELIPFFSESVRHATYLWDGWRYQLHPEKLEKEQPEVVLLLLQEAELNKIIEF